MAAKSKRLLSLFQRLTKSVTRTSGYSVAPARIRFAFAIMTAIGSLSMPLTFNPMSCASIKKVPLPQQGSKNAAPGFVPKEFSSS